MLNIQTDVDYRLIYMREREFSNRVFDVYIAKQTYKRAPYFDEILSELMDIEVWIFLLESEMVKQVLSEEYRLSLIRRIEKDDHEATSEVFHLMDNHFIETFARDLFLFLLSHNLCFLERDFYDSSQVEERNMPLQDIW